MTAVTAAPVRVTGRSRWVAAPTTPARRGSARRDIPALDGIRAVAVLLVLADHGGLPGVSGGFLGVDVFFVLSGFLITSLLIDELGRTGRIDLRGFWIRRARRLLPALLVVVLGVVALRELFPPDAVTALREDAVAAFFWAANWAFVAQQTDYFAQGSPPSPLQHTWSLGVEEQYYLVWPLLIVAVVGILAYRRGAPSLRAVRFSVFGLAVAGAAASATAAVLLTSGPAGGAMANRVYFGTDTRVQALLIGAAAAALLVRDWSTVTMDTPIRPRWGRWLARVLSVVGVAGVAVLAHLATGTPDEYRSGLFTAAAVASVLVVATVALDQGGPVARLLACPPLVWLGTISYGVYLWHWPIFLLLNGERTGWSGWSLFAVRCAVTLAVAVASYWVLERPIRQWRPVTVPMLPLAVATAATAAVVTLTVVPVGGIASEDTGTGDSFDIASAAAVMPEIPIPVGDSARPEPGTRTVAVFGDSIAWTLMRYLPATPGLQFANYTTIGCGIARGGPYRTTGETLNQKPECETWPTRWAQRIGYDRPDVVLLMIGRWEMVDRLSGGKWTHIGEDGYDAYLRAELNRAFDVLSSTGARVVATTAPYNRRAERADGSLYPEDEPERADDWNDLLREVAKPRRNVTVLDLNEKMSPRGYYTTRTDGIRMRSDGVHPTPEAVEWLTPWLTEALTRP
ncbi:acyltransferase family protein [Mycolicibacterium sp. S2-37]|uniref:acyltransferase family protein n=1 Tax=Mycolicibacterium sp. S2-37 TaxID=2810297 RepID=UPI001A946975|nr:acyltransferase family protein [Mycolicibacterium sp. S2-37]MBO0680391.1 acyltransferase family protein [Mycolicibacterium sp. S2-37]